MWEVCQTEIPRIPATCSCVLICSVGGVSDNPVEGFLTESHCCSEAKLIPLSPIILKVVEACILLYVQYSSRQSHHRIVDAGQLDPAKPSISQTPDFSPLHHNYFWPIPGPLSNSSLVLPGGVPDWLNQDDGIFAA